MPYLEDGETWDPNEQVYDEGMVENKPGHKSFKDYKLPTWVKHPLSHPFNGVLTGPQEYYHAAGDGFSNPMAWSIAHVGCRWGDVDILEMCTDEELNHPDIGGNTPAHHAVSSGSPWCLQWLSERGSDVKSANNDGRTPEDAIYCNANLHLNEQEWCYQALKGELTEKNLGKALEYRMVKQRASGNAEVVTKKMDKDMKLLMKFWHNQGTYEMPIPVPTPEELAAKPLDLPESWVPPIEKKLPPLPLGLLFPGQGSQYVGMLKEVADRPAVRKMLDMATPILGWDVKDLCLNGPEDKLQKCQYCLPVMYIAGLAAMEVLAEKNPDAVARPQCMAGLSVGEYCAIVAAGVLEFDDGLKLVKTRAEAMKKAIDETPQAMCSIAGLDRSKVDKLCEEAKEADKSPNVECKVSNFLFPAGFTVGGTDAAIDQLCKLATAAKALQARRVKAGGAYHTKLMEPAAKEFNKAVDSMKPKMKPPRCSIYFNATGKKVKAGTEPHAFVDLMKKQLTNEVLWEPLVKAMIMDGIKDFYEVGPLKQIKAMIKRIDAEAFKRTENIPV